MKAWLRVAWEHASAAACVCLLFTLVFRSHPYVAIAQGVVCCLLEAWAGWRITRSRAGGLVSAMVAGAAVPMATLTVYVVLGAVIASATLALHPAASVELESWSAWLPATGAFIVIGMLMGLLGGWRGSAGPVRNAT